MMRYFTVQDFVRMRMVPIRFILSFSLLIALQQAPQTTAGIVQNGGFETGKFSPWALAGDPVNTFVSFGYPHSGSYGVLFGALNAPEFISQTLATSPGQTYTLSFWMGSGDSGGGIPNGFIVKWGDKTLLDQVDLVIPAWTNMQFTVTAASGNTILTFGGWDAADYIMLDDVSVVIPGSESQPKFLTFTNAGGLFEFTWSSLVGRSYQVQYRTDLAQGTWVNLGNSLTATNTVMAASDSIGVNTQRLYRLVLLP